MKRILLTSLFVLTAASVVWARPALLNIPSKEYSNNVDEDYLGVVDPHQVIVWDGTGVAGDSFDYTGAGSYPVDSQVDALANHEDSYFFEVVGDEVVMLASFTGVGEIYYTSPVIEAPVHGTIPKIGIWANSTTINAASPPDDVDALEVWGPIGPSGNADRFSLVGDPDIAGVGRVSVWNYDSGTNTATPFITAFTIAEAIGRPDLFMSIDVDALMSLGDTIMFSITPIDVYDGGEVWVWTVGVGLAKYLAHGGCTWNTAHSVMDHFGVGVENINALEAVPEPTTIMMLGFGGLVLLRRRRVC